MWCSKNDQMPAIFTFERGHGSQELKALCFVRSDKVPFYNLRQAINPSILLVDGSDI